MLGDDALWIVPRLWSYAAENQPDGDFSGYSSEELAMLVGCSKHAASMLQALKASGFIDTDGKIHDWEAHNGYHKSYSDRAKKAAKARWEKEKKEKKQKKEEIKKEEIGKRKEETSIASSMLQASPWLLDHGICLPENLQTEQCMEAAKIWMQYKRERRDKYTPTGLASCVKRWAKEFTAIEFPEAVEYSISQSWKGVYRERLNGSNHNNTPRLIGTNTPDDSGF